MIGRTGYAVTERKEELGFHILATIGDRSQLSSLLALARLLAQNSNGEITLLCITPDGSEPDWLGAVEGRETPIRVETRAGIETGQVILKVVREIEPDLLLLGWSGEEGSRRYLLGSTLDPVIRFAPCNVAVVRADEWPQVRRALVPAGGGPNAGLSVELALRLSPDVQVTAFNVAREATGPVGVAAGYELLTRVLEPWEGNERITTKVSRSSGIIDGLLSEAAAGYDALLIGASNESYIDRKLFGDVPQTIAANAPIPTIVVRRRAGPLKSLLRQAEFILSGVQDYLSIDERVQAYREVRRGARPRTDFFVMIGFAAAIAALGLLMNSPAVIIGAMVIAPLMAAIFGISLGIVQGDTRLLWQAAGTTLQGAMLAIAIGAFAGLIVPLDAPTYEILGRTRPTLMDLAVALVSGAAGAYAQCRRNVLGAVAGVAIAVALVPPLATTGIGLTLGSGAIAGGASLLFLTNLSAITAAGSLVFLLFGFRPDPGRRVRVFSQGMIGTLALLVIVSGFLTVLTIDSIRQNQLQGRLQTALSAEIDEMTGVELASWTMGEKRGRTLYLEIEVRAVRAVSHQEAVDLQERVAAHLRQPVALALSVTSITRLDPLAPPAPATQTGN